MKDLKYIRKRFLKAIEKAKELRLRVRNNDDVDCQFGLATDISNVSHEYEQIIEALLKIKH